MEHENLEEKIQHALAQVGYSPKRYEELYGRTEMNQADADEFDRLVSLREIAVAAGNEILDKQYWLLQKMEADLHLLGRDLNEPEPDPFRDPDAEAKAFRISETKDWVFKRLEAQFFLGQLDKADELKFGEMAKVRRETYSNAVTEKFSDLLSMSRDDRDERVRGQIQEMTEEDMEAMIAAQQKGAS